MSETKKKTILLVDLSWLMYRNRFGLDSLSFTDRDGIECPSGHVVGTVTDVRGLALTYDVVVLVCDSPQSSRKALYSGYKAKRREKSGDPRKDYVIHRDRDAVLTLLSLLPNVHYASVDGLEADDIMASYIHASNVRPGWDLCVAMNDHDILQTPGIYTWFNALHSPPVDRQALIRAKYGFDCDHLPLIWKVVRGDASDNIPSALPRFPSKLIVSAAVLLPPFPSVESIIDALHSVSVGTTWEERLAVASEPLSPLRADFERNYNLVLPRLVDVSSIPLLRKGYDPLEVQRLDTLYHVTVF